MDNILLLCVRREEKHNEWNVTGLLLITLSFSSTTAVFPRQRVYAFPTDGELRRVAWLAGVVWPCEREAGERGRLRHAGTQG